MNSHFGPVLTFLLTSLIVSSLSAVSLHNSLFVVRNTNYGRVRGFKTQVYGAKTVEKYLGIPYAKSPLGRHRFEAPVPPQPWGQKIRPALVLPPACPQPTEGIDYIEFHVPGFNKSSEDCLYLNIYRPANRDVNDKLPVMVFVHGGSYQNGMGAMFDGSFMAMEDVIVVTFNYRLGPLGFLTAADSDMPGNYGMLDQVAVLKWVNENIAHFGGNHQEVTIDGHSAGGCSVGLHSLSPLSRGLFKRVIGQSGSPLAHWAVQRYQSGPDFFFKLFASDLGCVANTTLEMKRCMQNLPSEKFEKLILGEFEWTPSLVPQYRPIVDGYFLPSTPEKLALSGPINPVDYMTGATKDEGLIAALPLVKFFGVGKKSARKLLTLMNCFRGDLPDVRGIVDSILEEYTKWPYTSNDDDVKNIFSEMIGDYFITAPTYLIANIMATKNVSVYVYNFEYQSMYDDWEGVIHGAELFFLSGFPLIGHPNMRYDENDRTMAKMLLTLWANFVKSGVPSLSPVEDFNVMRYTRSMQVYAKLYRDDGYPAITMENRYKTEKMSFWNKKVPEMYREQLGTVSYILTDDIVTSHSLTLIQTSPTWILTTACVILLLLLLVTSICYCRAKKQIAIIRNARESFGARNLLIAEKAILGTLDKKETCVVDVTTTKPKISLRDSIGGGDGRWTDCDMPKISLRGSIGGDSRWTDCDMSSFLSD